ncbi:MAG: hypothetical protein B7Z83_00805 [Thiomonas sp. 20-64-5]|nr:MAG: hypothetical protein B7Z83_00805 [Thiomonas sp. 20-64-5]
MRAFPARCAKHLAFFWRVRQGALAWRRNSSTRPRRGNGQGRGRTVRAAIEKLNPALRGWKSAFCLTRRRRPVGELDAWVRRRPGCLVCRQ